MNEVVTNYDVPADLADFLADPPLLKNENRHTYFGLRRSMIATIAPKNACEWVLAIDLVNLTWEIHGLGKRKASLVNMMWKKALCMLAEEHIDDDPVERRRRAQQLANQYFTKEGREAALAFLASFGLTEEAIAAQAEALRLPELGIVDRKMDRARVARMAIGRDIGHHRVAETWKQAHNMLAIVDGTTHSPPPEAPADRVGRAQ